MNVLVPHHPQSAGPTPQLAVAEEPFQGSITHELQAVIDGLSELVALIRCDGTILMVNRRWHREIERQGIRDFDLGRSYYTALSNMIEAGDDRAKPILEAFREISRGARQSFRCVYIGSGFLAGRDYSVSISGLMVAGNEFVLVSAEDLTELNTLKRQRRRIDTQVLRAQEEERRRLARELHDSVSQMLVALDLNLAHLRDNGASETRSLISECMKEIKDIQREVRSFSFLAHPPSLSNQDLGMSLERLTTGFAVRTGLEIDLQLSDVGEASPSVEAALYRLAQEAMSNIHRHAAATSATVRLVGTARCLHMIISDDGIGFNPAEEHTRRSMGVGVIGMGERVRQLAGRFSIRRSTKGTIVSVALRRN